MVRARLKPAFVVLLSCVLTGCAGIRQPEDPEHATAFVHVNVVPIDRDEVLEDQTVVVIADRIRVIGPSAQIDPPSGATVIDAGGRFLVPGLADMHVHLWYEGDLLVYVANGVTTVRSLFGNPTHLEWREQIKRSERLGPTIYTTGPILDGDPAYWRGSVVVTTPKEAAAVVLDQKHAGYDGVKVYDNLLPDVYHAILAAAKEHDLPVYGHVPSRMGLRQTLTGGQRSFEHMFEFVYALLPDDSPIRGDLIDGFGGKIKERLSTLFWVAPYEHADETRIPGLVSEVVASGAWICPTLVVAQRAARDSDEVETLLMHPSMAFVAPDVRAFWRERDARLQSEQVNVAAMKRGVWLEFRSVEALHHAGAKLLLGTDTPNPYVFPGLSVHEELQNLVDAGLSPYEALKAATADAAGFLGASAEFGRVATGVQADLLLLNSNPLDDVKATRNRAGVMVRGRWYSESDLTARLVDLAARYAREETERKQQE